MTCDQFLTHLIVNITYKCIKFNESHHELVNWTNFCNMLIYKKNWIEGFYKIYIYPSYIYTYISIYFNPFATVIAFLSIFAFVLQLFPIRLPPHSRVAHRYLGTPFPSK